MPADFDFQDYTILIVDDTPVNLGVIVDFLEGYGFGIRIARSGASALKRVQYDLPDIILLDILMPDMDGFEVCRRLRALEATKDIPVIFMTALTGTQDQIKGFEVGAVDYITKPLHQEEVLARIKTHLRLRNSTLKLQEQHKQLEVSSRVERERLFEAVRQQRQELRALNQKLTDVQEIERRQLARELHDEMGQALTMISFNLTAIEQALGADCAPNIRERLVEANELAEQTLEQIRELSFNLHPTLLDDFGLFPALRQYVRRYEKSVNIHVELETVGPEDRLPPKIEMALYRIVQEALTNIARHAQAHTVHVYLARRETRIAAVIEDDGQGFPVEKVLSPQMPDGGTGLLGMRERVILLCGDFDIQSTVGQGTRITIKIPLEAGCGDH
jgi:signal transduction histidine kinase